jgi:hypothetical protein
MNPVKNFKTYFFKIHYNIISIYAYILWVVSSLQRFRPKFCTHLSRIKVHPANLSNQYTVCHKYMTYGGPISDLAPGPTTFQILNVCFVDFCCQHRSYAGPAMLICHQLVPCVISPDNVRNSEVYIKKNLLKLLNFQNGSCIYITFVKNTSSCELISLCLPSKEPGHLIQYSDQATGGMIGVPGFDCWRGLVIFLFATVSRTALGPTGPPI